MDACIAGGGSERRGAIAAVLGSNRIPPEQLAEVIPRLDRLVIAADEGNDWNIAHQIEVLLSRVEPDAPVRSMLLPVAQRCLRELPRGARRCVLYYATSDRPPETQAHRDAAVLLEEALRTESDADCQSLVTVPF